MIPYLVAVGGQKEKARGEHGKKLARSDEQNYENKNNTSIF